MSDNYEGLDLIKARNIRDEINKSLKNDLIKDCINENIDYKGLKVAEMKTKLKEKMYSYLKLDQEKIDLLNQEKKLTDKMIQEYLKSKPHKENKKLDSDLELVKFLSRNKK